MSIHRLFTVSIVMCLTLEGSLKASEALTVDFDGLSGLSELQLTNQIPNLVFEGVTVMTPATVRTSTGSDLTAAVSGQSAASCFGARIHFTRPVVQVTTRVSPSFVSVSSNGNASHLQAYLYAYPEQGERIVATVPVIVSVSKAQDLKNVRPSIVSVSSSSPIRYVTLDFDDPWISGGSRLLFDDLELTIVEPAILPPSLMIRRLNGYLSLQLPDNTVTPRLEYTTDLSSGRWQEWNEWLFDPFAVRVQGANSFFFRAKW